MKKRFGLGFVWILIGFLLVVTKLYLDSLVFHANIILYLKELIVQLGIAFLTMGIISIIVQFKEWKSYFQERLKDIVMDQSYLNNLNKEELLNIQINILKSLYKGSDIEKVGSFSQYLQTRIQRHVCTPFRDHVGYSVDILECDNDPDCFIVNETLTYTCKSVNNIIQDDIYWTWTDDEIKELISVDISVKCPDYFHNIYCQKCKSNNNCTSGIISLTKKHLDENYKTVESNRYHGYAIKIDDIVKPVDGLQITILSSIKSRKNTLFSWSMIIPTKDITMFIKFPNGYKLESFIGGLENIEYSETFNGNMYTFVREGWLLPMAGIAFKLTSFPNTSIEHAQ